MKRILAGLLATAAFSSTSSAQEFSSVYTDLDAEQNCVVYDQAPDGEGDWSQLLCEGYKGYPVFLSYSDARESVFYGIPPEGEDQPVWESFTPFNSVGKKVEWRLMSYGGKTIPLATIHRWTVVSDLDEEMEVLVVEKVGQPQAREGCAVGYVAATGNENANEAARRIADNQVFDFACGADQPVVEFGEIPVPPMTGFGDQ
ncbi:hypothetical protein [Nitratireductor basaltis]|uniref:Uncharacterized protein n=1 Tax=Nitratireductor basaltis TaxID=472175 RepID=A0A084U6J6_9HYPH|nr:hypothetical protein [Nitratireductor basaltis]KFB08582.1 hypothetical protein EL18_02835 [Nitratireductor basaltis]